MVTGTGRCGSALAFYTRSDIVIGKHKFFAVKATHGSAYAAQ